MTGEPGGADRAKAQLHPLADTNILFLVYGVFGVCQFGLIWMLVLFLTGPIDHWGLAWSNADALRFVGLYTTSLFFAPLVGGAITTGFGRERLLVIGGAAAMACGYALLAFCAYSNRILASPALTDLCLYTGLATAGCGSGLFKPNLLAILGRRYGADDPRRDGGFSFIWASYNMGGFIAGLIGGGIGAKAGWLYGFLSIAVVGMLLPTLTFLCRRSIFATPIEQDAAAGDVDLPARGSIFGRVAVVLIMAFFLIIFNSGFNLTFGFVSLFAEQKTDRFLFGFEVPALWIMSFEAFLLLPLVAIAAPLWTRLGHRGRNPSAPVKFAVALILLGFAFLLLMQAADFVDATGQKAPIGWLVGAIVILSVSEIFMQPIGYSVVNQVAPPRYRAMLMGCWLTSYAAAFWLAGEIGVLGERVGASVVFQGTAIVCLAAAAILLVSARLLNRLMSPVHHQPARPVEA